MASLEVHALSRAYEPGRPVVDGASFGVAEGRVAALLGPSGSGKTTVLRLIAGLERPDAGDVLIGGASVLGRPPHRRGVGLMFQELALFPHLDVRANVGFGPRMARWPRERRERRVEELLALTGLGGLGARRVDALSGGERQRVGLARALAPEPAVLLLDEPLGALDEARKRGLRRELRALLERLGTTALLVSHDLRDARALADDLIAIGAGCVLQAAPLAEALARPASPEVAAMLGWIALADGRLRGGRVEEPGAGAVAAPRALGTPPAEGARAVAMAHPAAMSAVPPDAAGASGVRCVVAASRPDGPARLLEVAIGEGERRRYAELRWASDEAPPPPGGAAGLAAARGSLRLYAR